MVSASTHIHGPFATLPPEIWSEIFAVLLAWDSGTGKHTSSLSLTCRAFYNHLKYQRRKTVALLDFDRILRFTRLLVSTPEDSEIRKIENLFILFSEDWSGELEYGEAWIEGIDPSKESPESEDWETSSLTSEEHTEIQDDVEWISAQPPTAHTSLVPKDEEKTSNEHQMRFIGNNCIVNESYWFLELVHYILASCSRTLKHLHWHTATSNTLGAGISLSSHIPLPHLEILVTSRSSSSTVFDSFFRRTENELADHLLWIDGFIHVINQQPGDYERVVQLDLPALRILHIALPAGPRPQVYTKLPTKRLYYLTEGWFDRFHEAVLEGCPSLELFGLTALDGVKNVVDWCQRADLDRQRLTGMYEKLIQPRVEESLERGNDEEDEQPTPREVFELWQRFLSGEELDSFPILPESHPEFFPP
ncbi:hypothetical protein DL96DRAFT_1820588 [Flagelloscypha sp. PMI_526]|nr:hypothetical protein DL96DRAFT_1820588 [Flagelloscypha sp. PMI_526]